MGKVTADFGGLTFTELSKLREDFLRDTARAFDKLVSGKKEVVDKLWIDADPFHDRNPRRVIQFTVLIEVRQETKQ